jgi:hypothetical protein
MSNTCSCGLTLARLVMAPSVSLCAHCDQACLIPEAVCVRCKVQQKSKRP